jgi:outer membrane protein OmpA-like peptidoglycan-associated protein
VPIENPKKIETAKIDTPQFIAIKPIEKPVDSVQLASKTTKDTLESLATETNPIVKPKVIIRDFLDKASVNDTVKSVVDNARNQYTISPVYFDHSKAIYKKESFGILDEVAFIMMANPNYKVVIKGHTDATGTKEANKALSANRAKMCYQYLIRKGVPAKQLTFKGLGQAEPVADNDSEASKQLNRRVEFEIIPN